MPSMWVREHVYVCVGMIATDSFLCFVFCTMFFNSVGVNPEPDRDLLELANPVRPTLYIVYAQVNCGLSCLAIPSCWL